jgi:tRNA uridine 5-carboxymethylaminomethyl modification enzyme
MHRYYPTIHSLNGEYNPTASLSANDPTPVHWSTLPAFKPFELDRTDSYIGVLIDDLTTKGATEPYRVFTARAEHRIVIRADNADIRLTKRGAKVGAVSKERLDHIEQKLAYIQEARKCLETTIGSPDGWKQLDIHVNTDGKRRSLADLLSYNKYTFDTLASKLPQSHPFHKIHPSVRGYLQVEYAYAVELKRRHAEIAAWRAQADTALPEDLDYYQIPILSVEEKERLSHRRPKTIGEAGRLEGVTPTAAMALVSYLRRLKNLQSAYLN